MRRLLALLGLCGALFLLPTIAAAQTAQVGEVSGDVTDAQGGVIPGATVTLTSVERGTTRTGVTDSEGKFRFPQLGLGNYTIAVTMNGFQPVKLSDNLVETDKTTAVSITMKMATITEATEVIGEVPIVDATNQTIQSRLRVEEFGRLPMARSYQQLIGQAPGVVGTGNVNAHGAITQANQFMADGVNTTDNTTGGFGNNMNYEAIQEVIVRTSGLSAEFGRSTGAYVDVITKSGTNRFGGSFKVITKNDQWDAQNSTKSEVASADGTFASLARVKFNKVNKALSGTLGGPIVRNNAWFFFAFEDDRSTTPRVQLNARAGITPEEFQQIRVIQYPNIKGTFQISPTQRVWVKYQGDPFSGIVRNDYWAPFIPAERASLTAQEQGGYSVSSQYTSVLTSQWTLEATLGYATNTITVEPFERTQLNNGAPYIDLNDSRVYNGATFDGYVKRPRIQANVAANYFANLGGTAHDFKMGLDVQTMRSESSFRFPNNQIFYGLGFDPVARKFLINDSREDYDDAPSKSNGELVSGYVRDRFGIGKRVKIEAGFRIEHQGGKSDVGVPTVSTTNAAPRLSMSYAVTEDAKTLVTSTYGRFFDGVLQSFSDTFANVPQQENYSTYTFINGAYVLTSRSEAAANGFKPNTTVTPRHMDEFTFGAEHQIGRTLGGSVRFIGRKWSNFMDDTRAFNADGSLKRDVANLAEGTRTYKGLEFQVDKRFSSNWSASGSYTYSKTRGNHFDNGDNFTALGDYTAANCRQTVDAGLFNGGIFSCKELQTNLLGQPTYDRPHLMKLNAAYTRDFGPVNMVVGMVGDITSKRTYQRQRTISVLSPINNTQFTTMTYFYEPRGAVRIKGLRDVYDLNLEIGWKGPSTSVFSVRFETFNLFNNEEKTDVSNLTWCNATVTATCQTTVANFGTATTRAAFVTPRTYRVHFVAKF